MKTLLPGPASSPRRARVVPAGQLRAYLAGCAGMSLWRRHVRLARDLRIDSWRRREHEALIDSLRASGLDARAMGAKILSLPQIRCGYLWTPEARNPRRVAGILIDCEYRPSERSAPPTREALEKCHSAILAHTIPSLELARKAHGAEILAGQTAYLAGADGIAGRILNLASAVVSDLGKRTSTPFHRGRPRASAETFLDRSASSREKREAVVYLVEAARELLTASRTRDTRGALASAFAIGRLSCYLEARFELRSSSQKARAQLRKRRVAQRTGKKASRKAACLEHARMLHRQDPELSLTQIIQKTVTWWDVGHPDFKTKDRSLERYITWEAIGV